ncbi:MAG: LMBR1 domain-containing protein, partial [Planctomycetales bacterium]
MPTQHSPPSSTDSQLSSTWGIVLFGLTGGLVAMYLAVAQPTSKRIKELQFQVELLRDSVEKVTEHAIAAERSAVHSAQRAEKSSLRLAAFTKQASEEGSSLLDALASQEVSLQAARQTVEEWEELSQRLAAASRGIPQAQATLGDLEEIKNGLLAPPCEMASAV